ncbi:hypothetical protein CONPUDRAFT_85429 [Coniophora puteana RWD-64-598 SS2]|uniref:RanBD1 domain-containing protein n=1 Tax=Coniophora puteana (strain RWD-64-598) TaxID=741705 RepID=A0A5M3M782_CONPW|nr:uncharacterized protein CONPUDRAFT_85429 [Coniophora puteana RWD-64-598 SS2]EIW75098.1 hypothetical protein CONPUDRAFT_85429 [Coniophora puteana RWD-64-598 SS2]
MPGTPPAGSVANPNDTDQVDFPKTRSKTPSPTRSDSPEPSTSRKREREVSLEPLTPKPDSSAHAPDTKERDNRRSSKKGRVMLDSTAEEDENHAAARPPPRSRSRSNTPPNATTGSGSENHADEDASEDTTMERGTATPPPGTSPRYEARVRQISQGVEDISWRPLHTPGDADRAPEEGPQQSKEQQAQAQAIEVDDDVTASADVSATGDKLVADDAAATTATSITTEAIETPLGEAAVIADGAKTVPEPTLEVVGATAGDTDDVVIEKAPSGASTRRPSDSDGGEQEKGLKRKLGDRGVSRGPPENGSAPSPSVVEPTKRARDDADKDDNPREAKRLTPPPDKSKEKQEEPMDSTPKFGGFMAYASTSSPFASVKGQNIFRPSPSPTPLSPTPRTSFASSPFPSFSSISTLGEPSTPKSSFAGGSSTTTTTTSTATKRTGFEAFASSGGGSPFASAARAKSPPVFGSSYSSSSGKATPSALARSKSPSRRGSANAFATYASGGAQAFAPAPKRPRAGSPAGGSPPPGLGKRGKEGVALVLAGASVGADNGSGSGEDERGNGNGNGNDNGSGEEGGVRQESEKQHGEGSGSGSGSDNDDERVGVSAGDESAAVAAGTTFGERLRAERDREGDASEEERERERERLQEQEVLTGEEDEETIHQVRGKLYALAAENNSWKERGTGLLKLNVRRVDGSAARLVMRKEAVYAVLLNVTLFPGMKCFVAQDPRYIRFSAIEDGVTTHYNLRVSNAKIAEELLEEINSYIPPA